MPQPSKSLIEPATRIQASLKLVRLTSGFSRAAPQGNERRRLQADVGQLFRPNGFVRGQSPQRYRLRVSSPALAPES
jgi:hypothetical protein